MNRSRLLYRVLSVGASVCLVAAVIASLFSNENWPLALAAAGLVGWGAASHVRHRVSLANDRRIISAQRALADSLANLLTESASSRAEFDESLTALSKSVSQSIEGIQHSIAAGLAEVSEHACDAAATSSTALSVARESRQAVSTAAEHERESRRFVLGRLGALRAQVEQLPSTTDEYAVMRQRLAGDGVQLPQLGGWALTSGVVAFLTRTILAADEPLTVLELGSGGSSTWMGLALRASHSGGHVWSMEHHPQFAASTRDQLAANDVSHLVTVIDAPLVTITLDGEDFDWYDTTALPTDMPPIDLLLVDGPPGHPGQQTRYPALPALADLLAPRATIVLDDTNRETEKSIISRWVSENPALSVEANLGKATVLGWNR